LLPLDQLNNPPPHFFDEAYGDTAAVRQWLQLALKPASWKRPATERTDA
jgi:hypothetical protein